MNADLRTIAKPLCDWASSKHEIGQVWVFGSRARGDFKPDSDLDIAIVMRDQQRPKGERYGDWVALASKWELELQQLVPFEIDLDIGDSDIATNVIAPAIRREGIKIYPTGLR